jgi:hypothetical protein
MRRRIFSPREIILPLAKLARSAISWGKFSMPILFWACFFVFVLNAQAAEQPKITANYISSSFNNWGKSFTWKHVITGDDPVLLVSLYGDGNYLNENSVTFAGQTMTLASKKVNSQPYNNIAVYIYYLANPPQGEYGIMVNMGWAVPFTGLAITFNNCDILNPINTTNSFVSNNQNILNTVAIDVPNVMLVDAINYNLPKEYFLVASLDQTNYFIKPPDDQWHGQTNNLYLGASYKLAESVDLQSMGWNSNGGSNRTLIHTIIALNPKYKQEKKDPVILLPGVMGSYLNENILGLPEVWPNIPKMMLPGDDSYLNKLLMNDLGEPVDPSLMRPTDIFRSLYEKDFFAGLIDELKNNGYEENKDLFIFPYDWRWDLGWTAGNDPYVLIQSLKEKIEEVKNQTGAEKVNIIAHSMGGLIVKKYIMDYGQDSVDKFIDIGTPHLGSPSAFKTLMYGDNLDLKILGIYILNTNTVKNISQNFSSIYQLLPSRNYFDNNDYNYNSYIGDIYDFDNNGIKGGLNYDQSIEFMKNTGRNEYLLSKNDELHNEIDNFDPADYGVEAYNIVGCNQPTIGKIYILNKEKDGYEYGLKYINGDGTVPLKSAEYLNNAVKTYYATDIAHPYLPSFSGVKQLVNLILNNKESEFNYNQYTNIKENDSNCILNGWQVSFHSPIDLHIYDENNNHIGPTADGDIEIGIDGVSYDIIDGNKFAFLPKGHTYRIVGQATSTGTFNARIQDIENGNTIKEAYFNQVPLNSTSANVEYFITDSQNSFSMNINQDGDQVFEDQIEPSSILNQIEAEDLTKPVTNINIEGIQGNDNWYISDANIILIATDNENGSGVLKTEYSLDNGATWQKYENPILLNQDGIYTVQYKSIDRAGNIEEEKTQIIKIDKTAPIVDYIIPEESQEFLHSEKLEVLYNLEDNLSGLATSKIKIQIDQMDVATTSIDLFNYKLGQHQVAIVADDLAGNSATATKDFLITANINSTISDVSRSYLELLINNKKVKDSLINNLSWIQNYIIKYGQRQIKWQNKYQEALARCEKNKYKEICIKKVNQSYKFISYQMSFVHQLVLKMKYLDLLKDLDKYYKQKWITPRGYDIIKEDIKYLINELK